MNLENDQFFAEIARLACPEVAGQNRTRVGAAIRLLEKLLSDPTTNEIDRTPAKELIERLLIAGTPPSPWLGSTAGP